jgi:hypothetical protein
MAACTVPLAPDYQIIKQSCEVQFIPGASPAVRVHNTYSLQNSGTAPLTFIDAIFPDQKTHGRVNLKAEWDGRAVLPQNLPPEYQPGSPGAQRLVFESPWPTKEKRDLVVDYTFAAPADTSDEIAIAPENFHLGTRGWLPVFLPPNHILSSAPARPLKMTYSVRVPAGFVVLGRGVATGRKQEGGDTIHDFALNQQDLAPYVVAGLYTASPKGSKSASAIFWTLQPLTPVPGSAPNRIGAAWAVLQKNFGVLSKRSDPPYLVESFAPHPDATDESDSGFGTFPGGALITPAALASGIDSDAFAQNAYSELARTWFGDALRPAPAAVFALGRGLPSYAAVVINEASGGAGARDAQILKRLNDYDQARQKLTAPEKAVAATTSDDSVGQRSLATAKAALLFIALEDANGEAPVRAGLAQAVQLLRGKEVSVNDVRAAIEYTTGKNLAEPFRIWLYNPGIPESFRTRYAK